MLCRYFCAAAIVCLAINSALAQDPTKVAPKHYKLHFENEHVQVVISTMVRTRSQRCTTIPRVCPSV